MNQTADALAVLAAIVVWGPIIFFVFTVVVMILIVSRLRHIREELTVLNKHMMAIRFPNLPWPQPHPDQILTTDRRNGVSWRMRGDGRWEYHRGLDWRPASDQEAR